MDRWKCEPRSSNQGSATDVESTDAGATIEDLFRRESAHLVSALVRLLGPSHVALAEDVVHDALISAMQAWRFAIPDNPKAWILQAAKNRAIDLIRRDRRFDTLQARLGPESAVDSALSPKADAENQLAMMFAICDDTLSAETHVTLILRLLCGFSGPEIAKAFLVDVQTIDRRLHRGRARLKELGHLPDVHGAADVRARQPSIEHALYLLFSEGYHGSDADNPLHPAMCADAIRLVELLLEDSNVERTTAHALAALFCFNAARVATRLDADGVFVPLADQDRTLWNRALFERGAAHLAESVGGDGWTRWHLEAGIALEHTSAPSVAETNWEKIVEYYDALLALSPSPVVALNRGLAIAELRGLDAARAALLSLERDPKLADYSFYWAGRADIERRSGHASEASRLYQRATMLAKSGAERRSYERRLRQLEN
jgi:RNA polymerase sigma factor (sigma-70 family)